MLPFRLSGTFCAHTCTHRREPKAVCPDTQCGLMLFYRRRLAHTEFYVHLLVKKRYVVNPWAKIHQLAQELAAAA